MKKIVFFAVFVLAAQVQAQKLFNPLKRLGFPGLNAAGIPAPQLPQPQPGPQTRGSASPTAIMVGAAIGGLLGSNSQKTTEGAAIGGALGLLIDKCSTGKPRKKQKPNVKPPWKVRCPRDLSLDRHRRLIPQPVCRSIPTASRFPPRHRPLIRPPGCPLSAPAKRYPVGPRSNPDFRLGTG